MPDYKKIISEIEQLDEEIADCQNQFAATRDDLNENRKSLDELKQTFGDIVIEGDAKKITAQESKIEKISGQFIQRNLAKLKSFDVKLEKLRQSRADMEELRIAIFKKLIKTWLADVGIKRFDIAARALKTAGKKLQAAHQIARELGDQALFAEAIGEAFSFLPEARVPTISDFNRGKYVNAPTFQVTTEIYKNVMSEIID